MQTKPLHGKICKCGRTTEAVGTVKDKNTVIFEYQCVCGNVFEKEEKYIQYLTEESDQLGRCRFVLSWWDTYHPGHPEGEHRLAKRGQVFFADPRNYGFLRPEDMKKYLEKKE